MKVISSKIKVSSSRFEELTFELFLMRLFHVQEGFNLGEQF
jgi:hypothetical protein